MFYSVIAGFVAGIFSRSLVDVGAGFSWFAVLLGAALLILPISLNKGSTAVFGRRVVTTPAPHFSEKVGGTPFINGDRDTSSDPEDSATSFYKGGIKMLLAVFLLAAGLGILRYDISERNSGRNVLEMHSNQTVTLEGIIADEPDVRESNTRLILLPTQAPLPAADGGTPLDRGDREDTRGGKILLIAGHEPHYQYGNRVAVEGRLEKPKDFVDTTTLREVDYRSHLAKDGIYYQMFHPKITLLARGEGNPVAERLFAFKKAFIGNIQHLIPEPHVSLLGGLIIGAKQSLGKKLLDDFRTVGVIHIVVLSGYNITIIARFIEWLFSGLRRNARLVVAALAIILFALMVGASATVVRATIMALLVLLAHGTGRRYAVTRALLIAGVIMLLHNPKILVFDTSFELSFLATVGLIYISPFIEPKVRWITKRLGFREIVVATIATQLFVLPFLLYKTGIFSVVSLPVNLLILAAIPLTMLFGFLAGILGFGSLLIAFPFAYVAYAFLAYELTIVEWFARLPFAAVSMPSFPLWLAVLWYALYAMLYILWRKKQSTVAFSESGATMEL